MGSLFLLLRFCEFGVVLEIAVVEPLE